MDTIIIYTGYKEDEIQKQIEYIACRYEDIIIKFGRYLPGHKVHFDSVLGINLASDNQYGKVIS